MIFVYMELDSWTLWHGFGSTLSLWNSLTLLCVVIICLYLFPTVFNYMTISHSCICFTPDEHLGLLWTFVCLSFGKYMCAYLLSVHLGMKSLGHGVYVSSTLAIQPTSFPIIVFIPISPPISSMWEFQLLHISTVDIVCLFNFSHFGGLEVASYCRMIFLRCKLDYVTPPIVSLCMQNKT